MVTWLQLTSILLVCLLSELENSSAFPRARSPVYPGTWQVLREKQQAGYNSGNRRPLQYIHARRQAHGKQQPNVHDPVQVKTWQNPQGSSLSYSQPQNQPGLYHQTQNSNHISLPQTPQRNPPLTMPRSFEFSLKVPFASSLGQSKETSQTTKGSDLNSDGSDGDSQSSQLYRPTSVQIHSSFNSPSGSDGFLGKGSTNDPNVGKNVHEVSKPSFQISLSVPIPSTTESPIPSSSNGNHFTNIKRPGTSGFVQNSYMEPSKLQSSSTQSNSEWILSDPGRPVQQQTQPQIYGPVHIQHTESKPVTYEKGHSGQTVSPNPANVHPVLSTSQDEMVPSGHYGAGQVKPTGDGYGQHQTWQPVGIQPTFASDVHGQNIETGETDSGIPVQQQTEHQIFKPLHIKHTDSKPITFSPVYASQHAAPAEQISHGKIPTKQSQIFEKLVETPSLPIYHYPQQSENVYSGYYTALTNPTSTNYEKGQRGQTVSPNPANVHPVLSTLQYEMVPSGHYGAGQVKPTGDGYGQHQTWQPVGIQPTFASDVYGQNIKTGETDSGIPVQQQTEHQIFKPLHIKHTDSKPITFSPVYASQHAAPAEQISHGKIPTKQSQIFEKLVETPSLPIYHYPQQSENVYSGYYTALTNPTSTNYEKGQRGQTLSSNPANVHPVLSTLQYEMVPSGHYGAGQTWQPVGLQPTFASDGHGQNVERDSGRPVQQQTEHQLYVTDGKQITFSSGYASQYAAPTEQASQGKIPPKQSQIFEKLVQTPSLPIYHYPQQSDNVYSGYHTVQTNPTSTDYEKGQSGQTVSPNRANVNLALPPSQYERVPSGHYSAGHVKPSGNNYEQHQTWHPVGIQPTFAYDSYRQNIKSVSHSSPVQSLSPTVAPSQYELSSFSHNREIATTTDYGTGNMAQMGQTDFSSSSHQYSRGQSGQDALPNHPTAFHSLPNLQDLSSQYQTQMRLPGKETGKGQINKNPSYTKLFIDVEDVVDGSHGQNNFAAPIMHFDGYSGQNMGETLISNTNPLLAKLQSQISVSQGRLTGLLSSTIETSPRNKPNSYMPFSSKAPIMGSGVGQYASYPQEQRQTQQSQTSVSRQVNMAPHVGANTVQQFPQPMDYAPLKQISNTNFAPSVAAYQY